MLPKRYRLKKEEIPKVLRMGKKYYSDGFMLSIWYERNMENPQFAFVISKKVDKRAAVRNKIKRKFRAVVQIVLDDQNFPLSNGKYVFLIKSAGLKDLKSYEIRDLVAGALKG